MFEEEVERCVGRWWLLFVDVDRRRDDEDRRRGLNTYRLASPLLLSEEGSGPTIR